jgi:predicted metal-dependent HD superfamily phosphohydrolase/phosphopantetheine adenylyltransferase
LLTKKELGIGITSEEMISKKGSKALLQPYCIRSSNVTGFVETIGHLAEYKVVFCFNGY